MPGILKRQNLLENTSYTSTSVLFVQGRSTVSHAACTEMGNLTGVSLYRALTGESENPCLALDLWHC